MARDRWWPWVGSVASAFLAVGALLLFYRAPGDWLVLGIGAGIALVFVSFAVADFRARVSALDQSQDSD